MWVSLASNHDKEWKDDAHHCSPFEEGPDERCKCADAPKACNIHMSVTSSAHYQNALMVGCPAEEANAVSLILHLLLLLYSRRNMKSRLKPLMQGHEHAQSKIYNQQDSMEPCGGLSTSGEAMQHGSRAPHHVCEQCTECHVDDQLLP